MLEIQDLGLRPYAEIWDLQKSCVAQRAQGLIPDRLLLVEHEPVYTLGRRKGADEAPLGEVPVYTVERGGEISFHEPGQLVGYPIFALAGPRRDIHAFLTGLEQVLIDTLAEFGFAGERDARNTGVWVGGRKVASIGIAVRRWVSWHGFALNVNNELALAQSIRPCGFAPELMTSLSRLAGAPLNMSEIKASLSRRCESWWGHG